MKQSNDKDQEKKKNYKVNIFPVPFSLEEKKEKITIITNTHNKSSKE